MILKLEETANYIADWISARAEASGVKSLVLGVSGGVDSALVLALCKRASERRYKVEMEKRGDRGFDNSKPHNMNLLKVVGVMMPCHSSPSSKARAKELLEKFDIEHMEVDLEDAFDCITKTKFNSIKYEKSARGFLGTSLKVKESYPATNFPQAITKFADQSIRSCLRAPTLDYVAKLYEGIVVGTGNRDEDEVTRYFQKRGDGGVDISPIAKLHKSEVYQLAEYLGVPESILKATPSADLMGPDAGHEDEKELGMTYNEIETAMRLVQSHLRNPSLTEVELMEHNLRAEDFRSTARQGNIASPRMLKVLLTLADMEEKSRHKENPNLPVCNPRVLNGVII